MNFLCQVGFTDKGYRCVCRNGFEGESCKGIEPYTNCLTPGVWRVLWISRDYGDDRIGAKSKKSPTASNKFKKNSMDLELTHLYPGQKKKYHPELRGRRSTYEGTLRLPNHPRKYMQNFPTPKIQESKISNLKISSEFPRHLKSRVTSPAPPPPPPRA